MATGAGPASAGAARLVPTLADLPGEGWRAVGELGGGGGGGHDDVLACVGPGFPSWDEVVDTAASPLFTRRRQLVHGIGVVFSTAAAGARGAAAVRGPAFARCLAASLAEDLVSQPGGTELLAVDVAPAGTAQRATFTAASGGAVLAVHLDVVVLVAGPDLSLLWLADAPDPFPGPGRDELCARLAART